VSTCSTTRPDANKKYTLLYDGCQDTPTSLKIKCIFDNLHGLIIMNPDEEGYGVNDME
jgi:hypothetical protein